MVANEAVYVTLDKAQACEMFFDKWLESFDIRNPEGDYFMD